MNKYSIQIYWSDEERQFGALSQEHPQLSFFADTKEKALVGIESILEEDMPELMQREDYPKHVTLEKVKEYLK
jgi:predicted RNase H-like HicB family nuclease